MKISDYMKLEKSVEKLMDEKRFVHTQGVSYTAAAMAMRFGADVEKARLAGLLHDSAKCMSDKKKIEVCQKNGIEITSAEDKSPLLLHGKVGAFLAKDKFKVEDQDILNAISYHTTGRPGMSTLEKIIYIADFIEPNRKPLDCLEEARRLAFEDLDKAMVFILRECLKYLKESGVEVDTLSQETYEYYSK